MFLGGSLLENCNWIDIIPQLDDFMRNGGEVIIQAHNSFDFINTSNWPNYSNDYISQEEELEWFLDINWNQYGVFGIASINENCINGQTLFGESFNTHPIVSNIYDYPYGNQGSSCDCYFQEPYWYDISEEDLNADNFFSIYNFGGDAIGGAIYGEATQMVFGKEIGFILKLSLLR